MLQSILDLASSSSGFTTKEDTSPSHQANALIDITQLKILHLLKEIAQDLKTIKKEAPTTLRVYSKMPNDSKKKRAYYNRYYWIHGAGIYNSKYCRTPALDHKVKATKENRIGGLNTHCS